MAKADMTPRMREADETLRDKCKGNPTIPCGLLAFMNDRRRKQGCSWAVIAIELSQFGITVGATQLKVWAYRLKPDQDVSYWDVKAPAKKRKKKA